MILVYLENDGSVLPKSALATVGAALAAKKVFGHQRVVGLLLGDEGVEQAANEACNFGLDEILFVRSPLLSSYLACPYSRVIVEAAKKLSPALVLACASTRGKDFMPRVAGSLGAGQASDVSEFIEGGKFVRPMFAGNVLAEVQVETTVKCATVRPSAFDPAERSGSPCSAGALNISVEDDGSQTFVSFETVKSERPELGDAEVVISGGRALKSEDNFEKYIAPLADVLGAAIGASRAAVDSGYAPNDWQVGQTGKVVAPRLYIAVGISGAIQHLAGMKESKVIVAINNDAEAPIFELADYGLVADLYEALPELTEAIKKVRG